AHSIEVTPVSPYNRVHKPFWSQTDSSSSSWWLQPPKAFRIIAYSSCAILYLMNLNWCSSGRDSSKVVLALTLFFLFCMSSVVTVTVRPFFFVEPSFAVAASSLGAS
nr:hypothetical protein [Tanacetum cinerariifolium]